MISSGIDNNFYLIIVPCKRRQKNELTDQIVYNFDNQLPKKKLRSMFKLFSLEFTNT